jgi:putative transposase
MCSFFKKTKQAFYKQQKTTATVVLQEEVLLGLVTEKRKLWKRGSGRNLHQSLKKDLAEHKIKIGRDKFFNFLRDNNLLIKSKRFRTKTTCSYHHFNRYEYLIKGITPQRSNEIWVSDITYLWLKEQDSFCYLSLVTDMYSRKIVGYQVHEDLSVNGCIEALKMALKQKENTNQKLTHHSDRGVQYCSHSYVNLLRKNNIAISMTQTGDPLENAIAERIHKTIKEEFTNDRQINFSNIAIAKTEIKKFIEFYNTERPHRSVAWLTPNEAHNEKGELKRMWKAYYAKTQKGDLMEA